MALLAACSRASEEGSDWTRSGDLAVLRGHVEYDDGWRCGFRVVRDGERAPRLVYVWLVRQPKLGAGTAAVSEADCELDGDSGQCSDVLGYGQRMLRLGATLRRQANGVVTQVQCNGRPSDASAGLVFVADLRHDGAARQLAIDLPPVVDLPVAAPAAAAGAYARQLCDALRADAAVRAHFASR